MIKLTHLIRENSLRLDSKVQRLERKLLRKFPQLQELIIHINSNGSLYIKVIRVQKEYRGQGIGSKVIEFIKKFADEYGLIISLSPEPESGYKSKLDKFYKNLGFIANKGRHKDYQLSSPFGKSMYRRPIDNKESGQ